MHLTHQALFKFKIFSSISLLSFAPQLAALDFSGYIRTGMGSSDRHASQQCFALDGALSKYRLGNECDHIIELMLSQQIVNLSDQSSISLHGMGELGNEYDKTLKFKSSDPNNFGYAKATQAYVSWDGVPMLQGASVWAGRRYYRRHEVYISDFVYWDPSGIGLGVENIALGDLQLSYAFFRRGVDVFDKNYASHHDFQIGNIVTNPDGALDVGFSYIPKADGKQRKAGWSTTVQHSQQWGTYNNRLALQYGRDSGTGLGQVNLAGHAGDTALRVVNVFNWRVSPQLDGQVGAVYQKSHHQAAPDANWFSLGARGVYAFSNSWKLALEIGHDSADPGNGQKGALNKFTIAPTWTYGGVNEQPLNSRPDLRFYYTYAKWNRAAQNNAAAGSVLSNTGIFGRQGHGSNFGVQVEYWW